MSFNKKVLNVTQLKPSAMNKKHLKNKKSVLVLTDPAPPREVSIIDTLT